MSADSCVHTLVMSPTLKSTLVPSGCSAEEAAGFGAPAVVVAVVSVNKQHIVVSPSPTLCCYLSYHDKGDQVGHSGRAAPPLAKKKVERKNQNHFKAPVTRTLVCNRVRQTAEQPSAPCNKCCLLRFVVETSQRQTRRKKRTKCCCCDARHHKRNPRDGVSAIQLPPVPPNGQ